MVCIIWYNFKECKFNLKYNLKKNQLITERVQNTYNVINFMKWNLIWMRIFPTQENKFINNKMLNLYVFILMLFTQIKSSPKISLKGHIYHTYICMVWFDSEIDMNYYCRTERKEKHWTKVGYWRPPIELSICTKIHALRWTIFVYIYI